MTVAIDSRTAKPFGARHLVSGAAWTIGSYGIGQLLRLVTNVTLARLLAPELFGIMQIVHSIRTGIELLSDVGIGQNIVHHTDGNDPAFYNTAWTLQAIRGLVLAALLCVIGYPVARFYGSAVLAPVTVITSVGVVIAGLTSVSRFLLAKRMQFAILAGLEITAAVASCIGQIGFAYLFPNIWGLALGSLVGVTAFMVGSHVVLPGTRSRFCISTSQARQILSFGKWIFASSLVYLLSTNFDRLYFAKAIPLEMLGVYGIARTLSELASALVVQLGNGVIFPFVSAHAHMSRAQLRPHLASLRIKFILLAAVAFSIFAAFADISIKVLYDDRYRAAMWMLPILTAGSWLTILANLNESTLLGLGRPSFGALANCAKFVFILIGTTFCVPRYGILAGVVIVATSDICRYVPILCGQIRERISFAGQDLLATSVAIGLVVFWEWLRWLSGLGASFQGVLQAFAS